MKQEVNYSYQDGRLGEILFVYNSEDQSGWNWLAIQLKTGIPGVGTSAKSALEDLHQLVANRINFDLSIGKEPLSELPGAYPGDWVLFKNSPPVEL